MDIVDMVCMDMLDVVGIHEHGGHNIVHLDLGSSDVYIFIFLRQIKLNHEIKFVDKKLQPICLPCKVNPI